MEPVCFNTGNRHIKIVMLLSETASMEPVCFNTGNSDRFARRIRR